MEIPHYPTLADDLGTHQIICEEKSCAKTLKNTDSKWFITVQTNAGEKLNIY